LRSGSIIYVHPSPGVPLVDIATGAGNQLMMFGEVADLSGVYG
jgi:hypothetical protein